MKRTTIFALIAALSVFILTSCNNYGGNKTTEKEIELQKKELELKFKEKELISKEKELNTAIDNKTKTKTDTTSSNNSLSYLTGYNNKYPMQVHLFEMDPLKSRLQKLLGSKFNLFTNNMGVETPILVDGQNIFTSGCYPHSCGDDESAIAVDTKNDVIFIGILSSSKLQTYSENSKVAFPAKFKQWVSSHQPAPTVGQNIISKYSATGTIKTLEYFGNNYLSITIKTANSSIVSVWCTGGTTTVYKNNFKTYWTDLKQEMKVGINGNWEEMEGEKQLNADRIDIL